MTKIALVGAGSAVFTKGLVADLIARGEETTIGLVDPDPVALEVATGLATKMIRSRNAPIQLESSTARDDVFPGADAIICTVGVGGRKAWLADVRIPRQYGIYQPVGDTIMPGGLSRALRMIPAMVDIASDMLRLCPHALFFNYGNPMSAVCRGVRKATGAPVIGLCHGVFHVAATIARVLGVDVASLRYTAVGINHLTWFTEVRSAGRNLMPALREYGRAKLEELFDGAALPNNGATAPTANPASWLLLETFGAFPAVLDRHVCEFFPHLYSREGAYFGKTLGTDCFSLERTIEDGDEAFAEMQAIASGRVEIPDEYFDRSSGEHEQVVEIIDSIRADRGTIYSANLPNKGQVPNLPADAVVESPVTADGSGLRAIQQPPLTPGVAGTLQRPFAAVEAIVGAALSGSREEFVQALLIDGSVQGHREAGRLADELLAVHAEHLPQFA